MQPVIWKVDTKIDMKCRHHRSLTMDLYLRKKKTAAKISSTEKIIMGLQVGEMAYWV